METAATALVTGGGSGIGRGIALALARRGLTVVLAGRRAERLAAVAHEIRALAGRATCVPADLCARSGREAVVEHVRAELGALGWIFHAAATALPGALERRSSSELEDCVRLNLVAPMDLTARLQPELVAGRGTVVLVGSAAGFAPQPYFAAYSATKAALCALAAALRYELEPQGVRVALLVPPVSATAMVEGMAEAAGAAFFPRAAPAQSGERLVRAALAGRRLWFGAWSDRVLAEAQRFAPLVVRTLLRSQRARFERMARAGEGRG